MAESGTYDYSTLQRRQKIAEEMLAQSSKPQQIDHWAQGLAQIANIGADTYRLNQLEKQAADVRKSDVAAMMGMLGGTPAAPAAPPTAAPAMSAPTPAPAAPDPGGDVGARMRMAESGGDPNAKNPNSSATGPDQFVDATWLETVKKNRPDLAAGKTDADLLAMRTDPKLSGDMRDAYARDNRSALANAGLPTTPGTTYLAHFAGPSGAQKVLSADPKTQVAMLLSPKAMAANKFLTGMTAGDLTAWADRKMGDKPTPRAAVADAMAPAAAAPAPAAAAPDAAAPPAQTFGGIPANQKAAIARGLATTPGSPAHTLAMGLLTKAVSKEREEVRPMTPEERKKWQVPDGMSAGIDQTNGKPIFSPPQTNIALNTTQKGQEVMATKTAEDFQTANQAGREAVKRSGVWDEMEKATRGFAPGATAQIKLEAKRYLKDLGLIQGEDVPDAEVFKMMQQQIAVHAQPKGQGAVSNSERELFAKAIPNMTMSPEALSRAIATSRKLDEYDRKVAQIYRDSARKNQGVPNSIDVNDEIEKLGSPLTTSDTRWLQGATTKAPASEPKQGAAAPTSPAVDDLVKKYGGQ